MPRVTVIQADRLIVVDGYGLECPNMPTYENLHAIQWDGVRGEVEFDDETPNHKIFLNDYQQYIEPYVQVFNIENARRQAEEEERANAYRAEYESIGSRAIRIRRERNNRINELSSRLERHERQAAALLPLTDSPEMYRALLVYVQRLRDLPEEEGFPWHGWNFEQQFWQTEEEMKAENRMVPWPELPE